MEQHFVRLEQNICHPLCSWLFHVLELNEVIKDHAQASRQTEKALKYVVDLANVPQSINSGQDEGIVKPVLVTLHDVVYSDEVSKYIRNMTDRNDVFCRLLSC